MAWTTQRVGVYLRELREGAGYSHDRLGERVGKSRSQLISYEQGVHEPGAAFLMTALEELGVELVPPPAPVEEPGSVAAELRELRRSVDALSSLFGGKPELGPLAGAQEEHRPGETQRSVPDVRR